ncbi:MAG: hypothetical protein J6D53_11110 [Blautia sp.]|nr:hypothetical protein [Blautia sp.]
MFCEKQKPFKRVKGLKVKTEAEIYLEYEKAMSQAETLMLLAGELDSAVAAETKETAAALTAVWKGESAEAFLVKCSALGQKCTDCTSSLTKSAEAIKTIAQNIYNAEMQALRLAETRVY